MTEEQLARAEDRLRSPRPGSKIEAAQQYGVDLTLLIENLRLTPAERVKRMQVAVMAGAACQPDDLASLLELESLLEAVESE